MTEAITHIKKKSAGIKFKENYQDILRQNQNAIQENSFDDELEFNPLVLNAFT